MTEEETGALLAFCALYDYRDVSEELVAAWQDILGGITYREAMDAAKEYYRNESRRIMPADIWLPVQAQRRDWLYRNPEYGPMNPEIVPPWEKGGHELTAQ